MWRPRSSSSSIPKSSMVKWLLVTMKLHSYSSTERPPKFRMTMISSTPAALTRTPIIVSVWSTKLIISQNSSGERFWKGGFSMRRTKLARRFATTAFGRAVSTLFSRIYFMATWRKREQKSVPIPTPCHGNCLTCRWFEQHKEELEFWESI